VDPVASTMLRLGLAWVFGQSAVHKLRDPAAFAGIVRGYRLVPDALAPALAALLGTLEVVLVTSLLVPALAAYGGGLALALLGLYSSAIAVNLARGRRDVDCGCLGPGHRQPLSGALLVRNGALALAALGAAAPVSARSVGWLDVVTIAAGTVVLALLFTAAVRLATEVAPARPERPR